MTTNPFYRFENSAWNTAFEPAFTPTVDALYNFNADISTGFAVGASLSFGLQLIRSIIIERNAAPYHFNFILVAPSPLPPVGSGTQNWAYYITDKQLYSLHPTQIFQIDITTVNGVITATTVTDNPNISYPSDYSLPLFTTEIAAYRALEIANQNGAAFFPPEYKYDSTTGIATSSVARLQDCKFNEATGFGERYPLITVPVSPYWSLSVPAMSADEKYMLLIINRIFDYALDPSKTASDIQNYILYLILPDGWGVLGNFDLTTYPRVQYTFFNNTNKQSLAIIGRFDVEWKWQRFFNRWTSNTISILAVMEITSPTTQLPYAPIFGKGYSTDPENLWYDFDQICFLDACAIPVEYYPMPAKTADHFQFNVIPSISNTTGISEAKIGLFDCNENFIQEIGTQNLITNYCCNYPIIFEGLDLYIAGYINGISSYVTSFPYEYDYGIFIYDGPDHLTDTLILSKTGPLEIDYGTYYEWFNALQNIVNDVNNTLLIENYDTETGQAKITYTSNDLECILDPHVFLLMKNNNTQEIVNIFLEIPYKSGGLEVTISTQFQASTDIPSVPTGEYKFGLYNQSESALEIYSTSNPIRIDNSDCFSTIIEFYGNPSSIAQGFEYYDNWRQRIRVGLNGGGAKPKIIEATYRQSNGVFKRPQNKQDLTLDLHTDFFDEPTQFAMTDATRHPYFVWNGKNVFVEGDIEVATIQDFTTQSSFEDLAQMKFSVLVQGFQPTNNSCINC